MMSQFDAWYARIATILLGLLVAMMYKKIGNVGDHVEKVDQKIAEVNIKVGKVDNSLANMGFPTPARKIPSPTPVPMKTEKDAK